MAVDEGCAAFLVVLDSYRRPLVRLDDGILLAIACRLRSAPVESLWTGWRPN